MFNKKNDFCNLQRMSDKPLLNNSWFWRWQHEKKKQLQWWWRPRKRVGFINLFCCGSAAIPIGVTSDSTNQGSAAKVKLNSRSLSVGHSTRTNADEQTKRLHIHKFTLWAGFAPDTTSWKRSAQSHGHYSSPTAHNNFISIKDDYNQIYSNCAIFRLCPLSYKSCISLRLIWEFHQLSGKSRKSLLNGFVSGLDKVIVRPSLHSQFWSRAFAAGATFCLENLLFVDKFTMVRLRQCYLTDIG